MTHYHTKLIHRSVLKITGEDKITFLQGLVTNDMTLLSTEKTLYACFLTPQGKFLHDFFIFYAQNTLYLTPEAQRSADLLQRLKMYKLRSKINIETAPEYNLHAFWGDATTTPPVIENAVINADPRAAAMGFIGLLPIATSHPETATIEQYHHHRIRHCVPDGSLDMPPERAILLEYRLDERNAISFTKGCYMGQELTARTHYRGLVRKKLFTIEAPENFPLTPDMPLLNAEQQEIGIVRSVSGNTALALLRLEEEKGTPQHPENITVLF